MKPDGQDAFTRHPSPLLDGNVSVVAVRGRVGAVHGRVELAASFLYAERLALRRLTEARLHLLLRQILQVQLVRLIASRKAAPMRTEELWPAPKAEEG